MQHSPLVKEIPIYYQLLVFVCNDVLLLLYTVIIYGCCSKYIVPIFSLENNIKMRNKEVFSLDRDRYAGTYVPYNTGYVRCSLWLFPRKMNM